ncbi:hypothetical protein ACFLRR_00605 [Bacteroidota bacterium]
MKLFKLPVLKHWSYLADFIVIVLGIVVAFSLNTYWNNMQNRKVELRLLNDLKEEALINLDEMIPVQNRLDSIKINGLKIINLISPQANNLSADKFYKLVSVVASFVTYDATNAVKEAIVHNNDIDLIQNRDLQRELNILPAKLNDYVEDELFMRNVLLYYLRPYLYKNFPIYSIQFRPTHFNISTKEVLRDKEFESYIWRMMSQAENANKEMNDYKSHIKELIQLIDMELANR